MIVVGGKPISTQTDTDTHMHICKCTSLCFRRSKKKTASKTCIMFAKYKIHAIVCAQCDEYSIVLQFEFLIKKK